MVLKIFNRAYTSVLEFYFKIHFSLWWFGLLHQYTDFLLIRNNVKFQCVPFLNFSRFLMCLVSYFSQRSFLILSQQGRRKQIKVGLDNFKIHFLAGKKSDKIQIFHMKTICITKRKQIFTLDIVGVKEDTLFFSEGITAKKWALSNSTSQASKMIPATQNRKNFWNPKRDTWNNSIYPLG